jgi:hypothetical protein
MPAGAIGLPGTFHSGDVYLNSAEKWEGDRRDGNIAPLSSAHGRIKVNFTGIRTEFAAASGPL